MRGLGRDLRTALRQLLRSPGYTTVVVLTLGLAIGANTALFSVVQGVLLRPLPYRQPERLVSVWEKAPQFPEMSVCYPDYLDWRKAQTSFEDLGALRTESFNLTGVDRPERLEGRMMSAALLPVLGVSPLYGRNFTAEEDRPGGPPVVLLTYGFWQRRFAGDPSIVGKTMGLGGRPHTIVGVLPARFRPSHRYAVRIGDVYAPLGQIDPTMTRRGNHPGIMVTGRLKPGVSLEQARAELESIGRALGERYPENQTVLPALAPLQADMVREVRSGLLLLMGAVGFVLLIAVANVANLALARATVRRKEMAVRAALGAGRLRLCRQLLCESTLVSLAGGALGLILALWGADLLAAARPDSLPSASIIEIDRGVLVFSLCVSIVAGILFGLAPALSASRTELATTLKEGEGRTMTAGHGRLRAALVVSEVALALMLLVGAGLATRAFRRLLRLDTGFQPAQLLTLQVSIAPGRYPDPKGLRAFYQELEGAVTALPGVEQVAISAGLPLAGASETSFWVDGRPLPKPGQLAFAVYYATSAGYLRTLGIPLLAGRGLEPQDRAGSPKVAVVDEALARHFFPAGDAIGHHLVNGDGSDPVAIVGIVRHVANYGLDVAEPAPYQFYLPYAQIPDQYFRLMARSMSMVVRTSVSPASLAGPIAREVTRIDPDQPIYDVKAMTQLVDESITDRRFAMAILGLFAALALLLAALGLYAVMAYVVTQRTREIGVRMALGAKAADVQRMVLGQALRLVGMGVVLGLGGALVLTRIFGAVLYSVRPTDPITFATTTLVLALVAVVAGAVPARRATRVDPMIALRSE